MDTTRKSLSNHHSQTGLAKPAKPKSKTPVSSHPALDRILQLQQTIGNRAVNHLLQRQAGTIQPKKTNESIIQRYEIQDCDLDQNWEPTGKSVKEAHERALEMMSNANTMCANPYDASVIRAAQRYFKLDLPPVTEDQIKYWDQITAAISTIQPPDSELIYECESEQTWTEGLCAEGVNASALGNIHLCPQFFSAHPDVNERAMLMIHEWSHIWGKGVNRYGEVYCSEEEFGSLVTDDLVIMPDAYAHFIAELYMGEVPRCIGE